MTLKEGARAKALPRVYITTAFATLPALPTQLLQTPLATAGAGDNLRYHVRTKDTT